MLLAPEIAAGLLGHFISAISGGSLYRRAPLLRDRLGERLFPQGIDVREQPLLPGANGSAPFDGDGLATRDQAFVEDGGCAATRWACGRRAAARHGAHRQRQWRAQSVDFDTGEDFDALVRRIDRGILVTEVMGQGVNLVTGDYSRGASGFWIENGVIRANRFRSLPLPGIWGRCSPVSRVSGTDVDRRGNIACGSLLLSPMKIAGALRSPAASPAIFLLVVNSFET